MSTKKKVKVVVEIETFFHSYNTKKKNARAKNHIKKWILESLDSWCRDIPIYIESDETGASIEDVTSDSKIRVIECSLE